MRHKYATKALVLGRAPLGEASVLLFLLTPDLGLVRARAQSLRRSGAKLQSALQTLSECEAVLVRGREGWRVFGAVSLTNWSSSLSVGARLKAARVASLILRLVAGEGQDSQLYEIYSAYLCALSGLEKEEQEAAECLVVLRLLHVLGLDAGSIPGTTEDFGSAVLQEVHTLRRELITRVNHGLSASGL